MDNTSDVEMKVDIKMRVSCHEKYLTVTDKTVLVVEFKQFSRSGNMENETRKGAYWQVGDIAVLRYDDNQDNLVLIGKEAKVIKVCNTGSPNWLDVDLNGQTYSIRGDDARRVLARDTGAFAESQRV